MENKISATQSNCRMHTTGRVEISDSYGLICIQVGEDREQNLFLDVQTLDFEPWAW